MQVLPMLLEVENGIANQLAGSVESDVAATLDLEELDPARHQLSFRRHEVTRLGAAAKGHDGRMLDQHENVVGDRAHYAGVGDDPLELECFSIVHRSQVNDGELH